MIKEVINHPVEGEKRIVSKFLFIPTTDGYEWRWLRWQKMEQQYLYTEFHYMADYCWETIRFID